MRRGLLAVFVMAMGVMALSAPARAVNPPSKPQLEAIHKIAVEDERDWPKLLHKNRQILDANLIEYLGALSIEAVKNKNDRDAFYFALLADYAAREIKIQGVYRLQLAREYWKLGIGGEALDVIQNVIVTDPELSEPYVMAGDIFFQTGNDADALDMFTKAIKKDKKSEESYLRLGELYLRHKEYPEAQKSFQDLLRVNPNNQKAKELLVLATRHEQPAAQPVGSGYTPNKEAMDLFNKARQLHLKGDLALAEETLKKAVALDGKFMEAWNLQGDVQMLQGKYVDAATTYERCTQLDPQNADDWHYMGFANEKAYDETKNQLFLEKAVQGFQKAVELKPGYKMYQDDLDRVTRKKTAQAP